MAQNSRLPEKALVALGIVVSFGWKVELSLAFNSAVRMVFCPAASVRSALTWQSYSLPLARMIVTFCSSPSIWGGSRHSETQMKRFLVRPRPIHTNTTRACLVGRNVQQILFGGGIRSYIPRCIDTVEPCRCSHNVFLHQLYHPSTSTEDKKSCRQVGER